MRRKKIAIVTPYGAQPRFDNYAEFILAQTLRERGWDARLYTYAIWSIPALRNDVIYKGVPVFRCRQRLGISPRLFFSIILTRPQIVICFHPKSRLSFTAFIAARLVGARYVADIVGILHDPYIVNDTDNPEDNFKNPIRLVTSLSLLFKELFAGRIAGLWRNFVCHVPTAHADAIVSFNKDEDGYVQMIYGRDSTVIYWCTPRFTDYAEARPNGNIPEKFLLFIGQIKRRKGWDTALDAIVKLKEAEKSVHLVFVSTLTDLREPVEYARERGILPNITFLSAVSNEEKAWLLSHSTYVLVPSRFEGFGLVVFEAFLARKPVFATTIKTFLEFLENRKNAMLFETGNGKALANAIIELDADQTLQKKLVEEGVRTAELFNYNRMVDAYVALFDSLEHYTSVYTYEKT